MFTVEAQTGTGIFRADRATRRRTIGLRVRRASDPVEQLLSLLSPSAAQLLVHPIREEYLFQDRAGTIPVTADGQLVGRILDAGPLSLHLTAMSDPARGVFRRSDQYRWIEFNGVNTAYSTAALPAPGVDKAQVFAAVRKLSDAERILSELSANWNSNASSFVVVSGTFGTFRYATSVRGSAGVSVHLAAVITVGDSPDNAVLSALHDIAGDSSVLRRNGVPGIESTRDKGDGNLNPSGTYPLFVGARGGTSWFFNGNIYGALITRFSAANLPTDTITAAEALLTAEITGAP